MSIDHTSPSPVVILGGYGVFGGKLSQALLRDPNFHVLIAGRDTEKAQAFCRQHGGSPVCLDRNARNFATELAKLIPAIIVDAAGPFQDYGAGKYCVAETAIDLKSHYLDLSDDAELTKGIVCLNERAQQAGVVLLSGVSSVPALSSAAVATLKDDFDQIDLIESTILPGNRAPRGLSVIRAILMQAGKRIPITRDGNPDHVIGWSGLRRDAIGGKNPGNLPRRWSSFIGAPDLTLFPKHYGARTVLFRAGLELSILHLGLWLLAWPVRLRMVRSLEPASRLLRTIAGWLEPFGTDRGGMEVRVAGLDKSSRPVSRSWALIAEAGDGPHIPAVAATILCKRLLTQSVQPGARACLGEFSLNEIEDATRHLSVTTDRQEELSPTLFQQALGLDFRALPAAIQSLHTVFDRRTWTGRAKVTRGRSSLSLLLCRTFGFPAESDETPLTVTIERRGNKEIWRRCFGAKAFQSVMSLRDNDGVGHIRERFGFMSFDINLLVDDEGLHFPVSRGTLFGTPLPKWLLPVSEATETSANGIFNFDVKISLPGIGMLVHYQGWLQAARADTDCVQKADLKATTSAR
ncbi:DUF4166 domain-containing protein [Roseibium sp. SCP14]|uniref:DUF4166 domain-containing protein n=1 Tax=Roseibium sp. SCP14 TaxID=3141375 RepID=UPI0033361AC3